MGQGANWGGADFYPNAEIGSDKQQAGDDPATFTACRTPIAFFPISNYPRTGSTAQIRGIFQNTSLTSNTYTCGIGLYAQDPDIGEIMYAYANAGANGRHLSRLLHPVPSLAPVQD
ncbi:hypothetical protein LJK87_50125 [Paenibacillus sp. P25]|nr:hypothetical protein LJK87_50125 [Paenibacillus sp. P25]